MIRYQDTDPAVTEDKLHPPTQFKTELEHARTLANALPSVNSIEPCPVSGEARTEVFFEKWGQAYAFCPRTWNLSLANMPASAALHDYFYTSSLAQLRASDDYQAHLKNQRLPLWQHLLEWVQGRVQRYLHKNTADSLIDWGPKAQGWSELLRTAEWIQQYNCVDPLPPLTESDKGDLAEVIILFDVIQRSSTPATLLKKIHDRMQPGGLLLASCRSGSGFDVLTLAGASESIYPLDHICLPSPSGMSELIADSGLELLELTTPGMLDVQLLQAARQELPRQSYFQRYLMEQASEPTLERLQSFLQQNNLSSHMRLVARKPLENA